MAIMLLTERLRSAVKSALRVTGIRPYWFGLNFFDDVKTYLPNLSFRTIFDVGANEGQSARLFRRKYPGSVIYCFEPNGECCTILKRSNLDLKVYPLALGNKTGAISFDRSRGESVMYFVSDRETGERVPIERLDVFCQENNVSEVDFLKIDTEGHDLEVVRGAEQLLAEQRVGLVQTEVSMNRDNTYHVSFVDVHRHMEDRGYRLFGVYEPVLEWSQNAPYLHRTNMVYVSGRVAAANQLKPIQPRF